MRLLGVIENVNPRGDIIVRAGEQLNPAVGSKVFDKKRRPVGSVRRVFGPVKKPYIAVRAVGRADESAFGLEVYSD